MLLPLAVRNNNTNNTHLILVNGAVLTSSTSAIDGQLEARSRGILISGQPFSAPYYICGQGEMSEPVGERRPGSHMCRYHGSHGRRHVPLSRVTQSSSCAVITGHSRRHVPLSRVTRPSSCAVITGHSRRHVPLYRVTQRRHVPLSRATQPSSCAVINS